MTTKIGGSVGARIARITSSSTATADAEASTPTATTPSAPASSQETEPQHPPCDVPHHLTGQGCGWIRCPTCGEEYELGPKISRDAGFHFFPDGEYAYWRHARESTRHLAIGHAAGVTMTQLLAELPNVLLEAKTHQKLMRNPALTPLRRLFR